MKIAICAMKEVEVNHPVLDKILEREKEHYKCFNRDTLNPITDEEFEQAIAIVEELAGLKFASFSKEDYKEFTIHRVEDIDSGLSLLEA